jgi:CAAX prenyl protease-like protein
MIRKPALWFALGVLAVAAAFFARRNFTQAFPLLSLDIRMDRQAALDRARTLASEQNLGPSDFRDAASFSLDESVQTFVELEGGGKPAFSTLVADPLFTPYRWRVRHFKEREKHEATFSFAADGGANGFVERLREDAPGAALTGAAARQIAESEAARRWRVDLAPFQSVEQSEERRPGGRVDHTFVYERSDRRLGEGRYRLRLLVCGDKLCEVTYFLKVPDAFTRRYEQMRAANMAIGVGGALAMVIVYGVGGLAFGLFVLARQRWVIWRQPVMWGAAVALAQAVVNINEWPLAWMQYDTALSTSSFVARQIAVTLVELVANVAMFSLSFMAAESLTRRAFPRHPQFWRLWRKDPGRSREVLATTAIGYLLVPMFVAYEVALYLFATRTLGWWTPSEALFNPDVLAAYAPWFSAIAKSFQAGFWEESLFRAVPIAGAALIGDRLGNRRLWIAIAFVVQALIFGAGHAPYPTQPAYARPVELVIPSIAFGLLYLSFGLLPGIVLHFAFDAFWFAMPLFASSAAGIRVQQIMIVAAIFVPLWVLIVRRVRGGGATDLAPADRNAAWRPEAAPAVDAPPAAAPASVELTAIVARSLLAAGALGVIIWIAAAMRLPLQHHAITATRADALNAARNAVDPVHRSRPWRLLAVADEGGGPEHRFVWTTAGPATYSSLLGTFLDRPGWNVFVRTFEGDVAERAETWTVHLDAAGNVQRVSHELPESRPGATIDEGAARRLAIRGLLERFHLDDASLKEVSIVPSKLPQRTDWTLAFTDRSRTLPQGEARWSVRIAGDEIADAYPFVFVPEEWQRAERNAETAASIVRIGGTALAVVTILAGAIAAIVSWSRRSFAVRPFLVVFGVFGAFAAIRFVNGFPSVMANLSTAQPLQLQLLVLVGSAAVGLALQSAAMALIAGAVPAWSPGGRVAPRTALMLGVIVGVIGAAARAATALVGARGPVWPSYAGATSFVPLAASAVSPIVTLLTRIVGLLLVVSIANRATAGWTRRRALASVLLAVMGGVLGTAGSPADLGPWIVSAIGIGLLFVAAYIFVLRHDVSIVPIAAAMMTMPGVLREGWAAAYPGALTGAIVAVLVMGAAAYVWFRALRQPATIAAARRVAV